MIIDYRANLPTALLELDDMATAAQRCLARWFDLVPEPTLDDLSKATQTLWRLGAVRKTLCLAGGDRRAQARPLKVLAPELAAVLRLIGDLDFGDV